MQPLASNAKIVRFGVFQVDLRSGELYKAGLRVKLQQQPLQVLTLLLEHPNDVVTREELRAKLWPTDTFVDFEHSLNTAVRKIRDALGDTAENPIFIETIPRKGYRFIAPLEGPASATSGEPPAPARIRPPETPLVTTPGAAPGTGKRTTLLVLGIVVVIGLVGTLGWKIALDGRIAAGNAPRIRSLAVLPLTNLSGDPNEEYFADGMTEELTTNLGKISALRVISRTSAMQYKGTKKSLPDIARELNVDAVIEGTVARSGSHLRITANLLQAFPEKHLWAESYQSEVGDALTLQGQIAQAVARQIQIKLTQQEQNILSVARPVNPEADGYQAYLLGRFHWNRGDKENLLRSIEYYEQALAKDPGNALAYAGLADSYSYLSDWYQRPREAMPKAKAAAVKALELDESLAAAHNSLCYIQQSYDWDWNGAEKECRRAIQLNPSFADAHDNYATLLAYVGRVKESAEELKRAEELDPLSFRIYTDGEFSFFLARDYVRAEEQAKRAIELEPDYFLAHSYLGLVYAEMGRAKEAVAEAENAASLTDSPLIEGFMGYTYAASGKKEAARKIAKDLVKKRASEYVCAFEIGTIHLRLGEREQAFPWFEKAFDEKSLCITSIKFDPRLDPVRDDPRLKSLLERAGFPKN